MRLHGDCWIIRRLSSRAGDFITDVLQAYIKIQTCLASSLTPVAQEFSSARDSLACLLSGSFTRETRVTSLGAAFGGFSRV